MPGCLTLFSVHNNYVKMFERMMPLIDSVKDVQQYMGIPLVKKKSYANIKAGMATIVVNGLVVHVALPCSKSTVCTPTKWNCYHVGCPCSVS